MKLYINKHQITNGFTVSVVIQTNCRYCTKDCDMDRYVNNKNSGLLFARVKCNGWRCISYGGE